MIRDNEDVFATSDKDLGCTDTVQMTIDTGDHPPIRLKPYRAPLNQRKIIDKTIEELLEANIIRKSRSAWAAPIIIVSKKDKTSRMCVDYRSLNAASKIYSFPLPLIDDLLASVGKAKVMTSLDLKSGYYQVKVKESDKEKTAFVCHKGLFEFNVLPFGLASGPSLFSELVTEVLQGLEHFSTAYIDDILIFSETEEEHLGHIQQVFDRLRQHKLKLKLKKCNFLQNETNYLGFIISKDGLKPDPEKVKAIQGMKAPSNVREVRGLIGCLSYYRRFVPSFSKIAEPIVALTRKNKVFNWTTTCQEAFEKLRDELVKVPLLAYPDLNKPYVLYTDASDSCVDHKPLKYILESPMQNKKIQLWALNITGYNCTIQYITGPQNVCADFMSRLPSDEKTNENSDPYPDISDNTYEINVINSNRFHFTDYANNDKLVEDIPEKENFQFEEFGISIEQMKDKILRELKEQLVYPRQYKTSTS
ncbi:Transposon Ty3-G Gag-Pol polyprotein,Transposon Ty3-I Gag-Pol polyprotein [Mytilus edulis]|uniref:Transposon Ty3-G Gag-Pol polyprotein,Transposon Ty3-I Gag-Pol polyprotein n=1 Tax=Mytilus edulis TaxID=6550 RepID=A0A8S3VPN7_MYTED|nr:Transposon Ty3-G Gag-Pol polyprotein,Transposon Ty3-I Gag-Pol polyprotein [Mytilus edulis]